MTDIPIKEDEGKHTHTDECYRYTGTCPEYIERKKRENN